MQHVTHAKVIDIKYHTEDIREYTFSLEKSRKYNPGSFVQLSLELVTASDIWPESRTFSIASFKEGIMRFIIKKQGLYTSLIFNELDLGDMCTLKYPFGDLFNKSRDFEEHLFLAGGVGITPFLGLVEYYESCGLLNKVKLFYSVKYTKDLLHYSELKDSLKENLDIFVTREHIDHYHNRRITLDDIKSVAKTDTNIYICGSKQFNKYYQDLLIRNGYMKIHMDEWEVNT